MPISATYARTTGGIFTVTSAAHGLIVGKSIYVDFLTDTSSLPVDAGQTVTVVDNVNAFKFAYTTNGTSTTGTIQWLPTNGCTYSQSGSIITITAPNHGLVDNGYVLLSFVGGSYFGQDGNYQVLDVVTSSIFTVKARTFSTTSGGVLVQPSTAILANFSLSTSGAVGMTPRYVTPIASFALTCDGSVGVASRHLSPIASFGLSGFATAGLGEITRVAQANFDFVCFGDARLAHIQPARADIRFQVSGPAPQITYSLPATTLAASSLWALRLRANLTVTRGRETYRDLLDNAAGLWGYSSAAKTLPSQQEQLVAFAAAALQEMFARAEYLDYFNRVTRAVTLPANTSSIEMADDVQNIHGYVRIAGDRQPLNPVQNLSEVENYARLYLTDSDDLTTPHVYYVRRMKTETAYGFGTTLLFSPTPTSNVSLEVEVLLTAPRYTWNDYQNATPLSIVHRYAASVLFPLMRFRATATRDFAAKDQLPEIKQQYQQARAILGYVDPMPRSTKPSATEPATVSA